VCLRMPKCDEVCLKEGCGSGSWKRYFFCGSRSGSAKILPLPFQHRLFHLKSNLAKILSISQCGLNGEVAL